jgi:hypothetical protein
VNIHGLWVISQLWTRDGQPASLSMINQTLHAVDIHAVTPGRFQPGPATPANIDPVHYLIQHGCTQLTTYQPDSRFWPFQWIEAAGCSRSPCCSSPRPSGWSSAALPEPGQPLAE